MNESSFQHPWPNPSRINDPKSQLLIKVLASYDRGMVTAAVGGLMTVPQYQANAVRLELLAHIAVGTCAGKKGPTKQHLDTWLNRQLGNSDFVVLEDPAEDVFINNVLTSVGDFRVFGGIWEQGAFATTLLIKAVSGAPSEIANLWLRPVIAILRLSDEVVSRSGLGRWDMEPSTPRGLMKFPATLDITSLENRVKFSTADLIRCGVDPIDIEPFILAEADQSQVLVDMDETLLTQHPLIRSDNNYVLAIPSAVDYAVRRYLLNCAKNVEQLQKLNQAIFFAALSYVQEMLAFGSRHRVEQIVLPHEVGVTNGVCASLVVKVGRSRFIHYLLVADDLERTASYGLLFQHQISDEDDAKVSAHLTTVRQFLEDSFDILSAHTVILSGFLGQTQLIKLPDEREKWTSTTMRLADLLMFLRDPNDPIDRMILLLNQEQSLAAQGLELPNHNGFLNLYQFWIQQGFNLRHRSIPHGAPVFIQIEIDYVAKYRRSRRIAIDEHCALLPSGQSTVVQRMNSDSDYASMREVPSYVSIDLLNKKSLAFLIERSGMAVWVFMIPPKNTGAHRSAFDLWHALELLIYRSIPELLRCTPLAEMVLEVVLDFSSIMSHEEAAEKDIAKTLLSTECNSAKNAIFIQADPGFLRNFDAIENRGEQYLLAEILRGVSMLSTNGAISGEMAMSAALNVLGGTDAKVLHTFYVWNEIDVLVAHNSGPTYRRPTEHIESSLQSAFTLVKAPNKPLRLNVKESTEAFEQCVLHQVQLIQERLKMFKRSELIHNLLAKHESLVADRRQWRSTARAVRGLHGIKEGTRVAQLVERKRAQLQVILRALIEAAACECDDDIEAMADDFQLDELVGMMAVVIELGRDSDVIYFGLATNGITVFPSGAYSMDADLFADLARPFAEHSFDAEYTASAAGYENWFRKEVSENIQAKEPDDIFDSDNFLAAWAAEYGLSFDAFREIFTAIRDMAVTQGQVVITSTAAKIEVACSEHSVTQEDVRAFLQSFGLPRRNAWPAQIPDRPKDVMPWRFERRFSISLRPLVLEDERGERFTFGIGTAQSSFMYILDSLRAASFDKDVFRSREMRSWLGSTIDNLGHAFEEDVADRLRALGWTAVTGVKMTQLGAPKSPNLGDVDVLAWHSDGTVLTIECKRLKASRTIAEIAQICKRFQGNVDDLLQKHLRRSEWIKSNLTKLNLFCKLNAATLSLKFPIVVNRIVPFKYLATLPIPASDIILVDNLAEYVRGEIKIPHMATSK